MLNNCMVNPRLAHQPRIFLKRRPTTNNNSMPRRLHLTRSHAILRLKRRLEQDSFPRTQMSLIVGLTGAAGLLFSFMLLQAGVTSMALRYPLALLLAYGVFLLLLWLWLRTKAEDYVDMPDLSGLLPNGSGSSTPSFEGGGGNFGGAVPAARSTGRHPQHYLMSMLRRLPMRPARWAIQTNWQSR